MEVARTDKSKECWITSSADESEAPDWIVTHLEEVVLDDFLARDGVRTEPVTISNRSEPERFEVIVGFFSIEIGAESGFRDSQLLVSPAFVVPGFQVALVVDMPGDCENPGELDLSDILNNRVEVLEAAISIDVGEQIRWFDGVVSSTRSSEIVRSRHWWRLFREIASELKVFDMIPLTVMSDVCGSARNENGEISRIIDVNGVCGAEAGLEAGTESISARIFRVTRRVIYLGTVERGARTIGIGDGEAVVGEGAQNSTRIVEEFQGFVAGVEHNHSDL